MAPLSLRIDLSQHLDSVKRVPETKNAPLTLEMKNPKGWLSSYPMYRWELLKNLGQLLDGVRKLWRRRTLIVEQAPSWKALAQAVPQAELHLQRVVYPEPTTEQRARPQPSLLLPRPSSSSTPPDALGVDESSPPRCVHWALTSNGQRFSPGYRMRPCAPPSHDCRNGHRLVFCPSPCQRPCVPVSLPDYPWI